MLAVDFCKMRLAHAFPVRFGHSLHRRVAEAAFDTDGPHLFPTVFSPADFNQPVPILDLVGDEVGHCDETMTILSQILDESPVLDFRDDVWLNFVPIEPRLQGSPHTGVDGGHECRGAVQGGGERFHEPPGKGWSGEKSNTAFAEGVMVDL